MTATIHTIGKPVGTATEIIEVALTLNEDICKFRNYDFDNQHRLRIIFDNDEQEARFDALLTTLNGGFALVNTFPPFTRVIDEFEMNGKHCTVGEYEGLVWLYCDTGPAGLFTIMS